MRITLSIGAASLAELVSTEEPTVALVRIADERLYEAKAAGGNCVRHGGGPWNQATYPTGVGGSRRRVALVVEDDPRLQGDMSRELSRLGFDVRFALHCGAARQHLAAVTPDVICIDVGLPDQSGYELCEYIRGPLDLRTCPF